MARQRNVVLAGETGVGKSSLINLIVNRSIAGVSGNSFGCTSEIHNYHAIVGKDSFEIWDTPGLDEGIGGTVTSSVARSKLRTFLRDISKTGGIHLLLFCTRGWRITRTLQTNYKIIRQSIPPDVPIAIVVTGLEKNQCMNDWWIKNEGELARLNVNFDDHACITTIPEDDLPESFQGRHTESQEIIHELILKNCLS
ncbi:P-loop containing nucleoside triphosphate hydrolase protein, partial [Scleroderma citrinum]